jgi:hypothetical protein
MTSTPILGNEVTFSSDPLAFGPRVAPLADDAFVLAWENGTDIFGRQLDSGGSFTGGDFLSTLSSNDPKPLSGPSIFQQADGRRCARCHAADRYIPHAPGRRISTS